MLKFQDRRIDPHAWNVLPLTQTRRVRDSNGQLTDEPFTDNVQVAPGTLIGLNTEQLASYGVTLHPDPEQQPRPDDRYYFVTDNGDGTFTATRKSAEQITAPIWQQIKAERDRRKSAGVLVSGKWFHTDPDSRIQQLGLVMMGASVPSVPWKTMDGSFTPMSQSLATAIFQAVAGLDMALFAKAEEHRTAMLAAELPEQYEWRTGWPAAFGE